MNIRVLKFGGTSVATTEGRMQCLHHIELALAEGVHPVVVVSAMGRKGSPYATDTLISLLDDDAKFVSNRELDLLLSTGELISSVVFSSLLTKQGIDNTVLTGGQAGIYTNDHFGNAQITQFKPERIINELKKHKVVIVPGFQGMTDDGDITTLGRGGSDTTATALGVALQASRVDIFTDVDGVYTADPRLVPLASPMNVISYTEVCNMAYQGSKVIHPRAVELAMQKNIPVRVRSTFSQSPGTLIAHTGEGELQDRPVIGIAHVSGVTQIKVLPVPGQSKLHPDVFRAMSEHRISIDFISISPTQAVFTVPDHFASKAVSILKDKQFEPQQIKECTKVSIIGAGISGVPGIMTRIVDTLERENILILQSADSHTTIWTLVQGKDTQKAVCALHEEFGLNKNTNE